MEEVMQGKRAAGVLENTVAKSEAELAALYEQRNALAIKIADLERSNKVIRKAARKLRK